MRLLGRRRRRRRGTTAALLPRQLELSPARSAQNRLVTFLGHLCGPSRVANTPASTQTMRPCCIENQFLPAAPSNFHLVAQRNEKFRPPTGQSTFSLHQSAHRVHIMRPRSGPRARFHNARPRFFASLYSSVSLGQPPRRPMSVGAQGAWPLGPACHFPACSGPGRVCPVRRGNKVSRCTGQA